MIEKGDIPGRAVCGGVGHGPGEVDVLAHAVAGQELSSEIEIALAECPRASHNCSRWELGMVMWLLMVAKPSSTQRSSVEEDPGSQDGDRVHGFAEIDCCQPPLLLLER